MSRCHLGALITPALFGVGCGSGEPPRDYFVEVALGRIPGASFINKFGRNDHVNNEAPEEVWAGGGARTYLTTAERLSIHSNHADDGAEGPGARVVELQGLDQQYQPITERIRLTGTTPVLTAAAFLRLNRAYVVRAGTTSTNVGTLAIDPVRSGAQARQALIRPGDGQTLLSHYTVPRATTALLTGAQFSYSHEGSLALYVRERGGAWRIQQEWQVTSAGISMASPDVNFTVPQPYPAATDLKWVATATHDDTVVYVQYSVLLISDLAEEDEA